MTKDEHNYGMFYFIHIFYHLKDNFSDVCVSSKKYIREWEDWGYEWYSGEYIEKSIPIIHIFDKKLLKYIKKEQFEQMEYKVNE